MALEIVPTAVPPQPVATESVPMDTANSSAVVFLPITMLPALAILAALPIAIESTPSTVAFVPIAMPFSFVVVAL